MSRRINVNRSGRVDKLLANRLEWSRAHVQELIDAGKVTSENGVIDDKSTEIEAGTELMVPKDGLVAESAVEPQPGKLPLVYEDEWILAVDKPAGIIVHPVGEPGRQNSILSGTLVNRLLYHYPEQGEIFGRRRAGLVHRLDKGTSGVLLIARDRQTHDELKKQFKRREVEKTYRAICSGQCSEKQMLVKVPLARDNSNPLRRIPSPSGKEARTRFEVVASLRSRTAFRCRPITGRTHQVRVHAGYIGHPVVGDEKYGHESASRLMLHAKKLEFKHPRKDRSVELKSSLPEVFRQEWSSENG